MPAVCGLDLWGRDFPECTLDGFVWYAAQGLLTEFLARDLVCIEQGAHLGDQFALLEREEPAEKLEHDFFSWSQFLGRGDLRCLPGHQFVNCDFESGRNGALPLSRRGGASFRLPLLDGLVGHPGGSGQLLLGESGGIP